MASNITSYINPYHYNRDNSVDPKYIYINRLSSYKPVYGSSVNFYSRLNVMQTIDNSIRAMPASENNLSVKFNLNFVLNDTDAGNLLKTIESASGTKFLKFNDPSGLYRELIGLVEDYSINKTSANLNEFRLIVSSYIKTPMFNWRTSTFLNDITVENTQFNPLKMYKKYDFVYFENYDTPALTKVSKNKINNFWFAKKDINLGDFKIADWSKNFIYEAELPFELKNKFDFFQAEYKNSFIQNVKYKQNSNVLKSFELKFTNISDLQCRSMLFFLEKKSGYRRFIYDFPIFLKKNKVFICTEWSHVFKYYNCHEISVKFIEDPNPNIIIDNSNYYIA